ncbi:MAG: response regulator [Lachnospiraceae bacterium]|nr:response regulator [Lachnospiraceae bacterium]
MIKNRLKKAVAAAAMLMVLAGGAAEFITYAEEVQTEEMPESLFTEEEKDFIEMSKTLKVGYVRDRKPVSFRGENGELAGISRSIFDRIAEISGLKFEYVELPAGNVTYNYLLEEGFDLVTGVEYNEENQAARGILISNPYLSSRKVAVAKDGRGYNGNSHSKVAISTGSQTIKKVISEYYPNFEMVDYPTIEACLNAVNKGEVDLLIQNQYVVEYWLYKPLYNNLKIMSIIEMDDRLCFSAVTPLEKNDDEVWKEKELLISVINKSIAQISDSEVAGYVITATMENMYEYTVSDFIYQYRFTLIGFGIAVVLICVLLYINMHIRIRSIKDRADAKAKGEFLSTMSHEIRTPLNGLIGLNYLMSQSLDDRDKISNYLQQSSSVAQYLLSLVNNVLDMSRLQESKMELEQKPLDLNLLLATVESIEKSSMEEKGIDFRMDAELFCPGILGDEVRIQQVLVNMIDNARKYTPKGGSVIVKVRQTEASQGGILTKAEILDTGRGMSDEFQKKIFDPFTQERNTVSKGNQGTGLGMAICSLLAERMGGSLEVESKLGEGSLFTFTFVAKPAAVQAEAAESEKIADAGITYNKPHILIAEDNELNGQILMELLEGEGFETLHAENGKKAVEAFEASAPGEYGVVLMDLMMPEMDGFEATKAIRALNRPDAGTVKIFACTANSFKEDRDKALESGMDDFITKPINIKELLKKLENIAV